MKIYQVFENYVRTDRESWFRCIDEKFISYHASFDGAFQKVQALVAQDVLAWDEYKTDYGWKGPSEEWYDKHQEIISNRRVFSVGLNGKSPNVYNIYDVKEVDIEP